MKSIVIIGAGPAGLTAAIEALRAGLRPVVLEASDAIGGISRTVNYKGNRMDIGGHRFFSKSDWVMQWWQEVMPVAADPSAAPADGVVEVAYRQRRRQVTTASDRNGGLVMLVRNRLSRIYFLRKYFDYPIKLNATTLRNLGPLRLLRIGLSYGRAMLLPRRDEKTLEDFFYNRFGDELYRTFFKDYTEKVWGVPCDRISAEWGAQRIKGLSVLAALRHALGKSLRGASLGAQKATKTSLIEKFLYPRLGPGQLWEEVARRVREQGGEIHFNCRVAGLRHAGGRIVAVQTLGADGSSVEFAGDEFISTMPVKDLIGGLDPPAPPEVARIAAELPYRDFITVGLLLARMAPNAQARSESPRNMPPDNWIYVQERDVRIGRLQVFNNWSPDLVADPERVWLGLEYFCQEGDDLWRMSDEEMRRFAAAELEKIGMIASGDVLDGVVVRVPKTYPAYFGTYAEFDRIRAYVDAIPNLWLVGRNGMHRYNNQDHSMLTAKLAIEAIARGSTDKAPLWAINVDDDYHEEKAADGA